MNSIEFWQAQKVEESATQKFVAQIYTDAPPPPVGAEINIDKIDYRVWRVDYSLDSSPLRLRRNVYLTTELHR
jgi:hypothetical protein